MCYAYDLRWSGLDITHAKKSALVFAFGPSWRNIL